MIPADNIAQWYMGLLMYTPRIMLATLLIPIFAKQLLPAGARAAVALGLASVALLGTASQSLDLSISTSMLMLLLLKEAAIGLMIGLAFGMIFHVAKSIGEIIDYQTASTFSQGVDPVNGQQTSTLGMLLEHTFLAFAIASGGLLMFAEVSIMSYQLWPVSELIPDITSRVASLLVFESSRLLAFALLLAGPMLLVAFMIDLGVGFLGRSAPQLNLLGISLPLKSPIALFVLLLALPFLLDSLYEALEAVRDALFSLMGG